MAQKLPTTLIETLVKRSIVTDAERGDLESEAQKLNKDFGQLLILKGRISNDDLLNLKSEAYHLPVIRLKEIEIDKEALKEISEEVVIFYKIVPFAKEGNTLKVGIINPEDVNALEALKFIAADKGLTLDKYVIDYKDFDSIVKQYRTLTGEVGKALESLSEELEIKKKEGKGDIIAAPGEEISADAPVTRIVAAMLKHAVESRASDIHIEPFEDRVRTRFRIDGVLLTTLNLPKNLQSAVVTRVKILSDLKIDENRRPQDGRFRTTIFGKEIDFRVSTLPTSVGEKAVLRVLDPSQGLKSITELGLGTRNLATLQQSIGKPYGMILITGPTGSGKTTTLYSIFQYLNREDVNIISLEDPVEYTLEGINQSQMMPEIGYSFATGLRQVLRQDPDIIMIGEIRDPETAELSVHAALTGHLVLSTLHTNNATGVIPRLIDMHVEPFLLAPALNVMIAQRLVSRVCQDCEEAVPVPPNMQKIITDALADLPDETQKEIQFKTPYVTFAGKGCAACKHKGVRGRVAIHEILAMTPQLALIISEGAHGEKIFAEAKRQGMISLRQDGILKSLAGQITIEEVLRETGETTDA